MKQIKKTLLQKLADFDKRNLDAKKRKEKIIIITCSALLLLGLIILSIVLIVKNNKASDSNDKVNTISKENIKNKNLENYQKKILGMEASNPSRRTPEESVKKTTEYKQYLKLTDKQKEKNEVIPRENEIPIEQMEEISDEIDQVDEIPKTFNLADKIKLDVRDQESYGLCWDFASMTSLETFMKLHEKKDYDFSEIHVDYIMSNEMYGYRDIHEGGNFNIFADYLQLTNPVLEEKLPYHDYEQDDYKSFMDVQKSDIKVTKTIEFPNIKGYVGEYTEEQIENNRNLVKQHLMSNGSLYTAILAPGVSVYYNNKNNAQYFNGDYDLLEDGAYWHAVSIVGWDDNYSRDNFVNDSGEKPKKDGAYIALNSWGPEWGNKGYFYISYEDANVESDLSGIASTSLEDAVNLNEIASDKVRQYLIDNYGPFVFTVDGNEYITQSVFNYSSFVDLSNLGLTSDDLSSLSIFKNVYGLDLSHNSIDDLSNLPEFVGLNFLNISDNKISNLDQVAKYTNLNSLYASNNKITDIDVINDLSEIYSVDFSNNQIKQFKLSSDLKIGSFDLSNNSINWDKSNVVSKYLYYLNLDNTNLTDLSKISSYEGARLHIANNNLSNLDSLSNVKVYYLDISGNKLSSFDALKSILTNDSVLKANNCSIKDLSVLNGIQFYYLEVQNNEITDVSKFDDKDTMILDLSYNPQVTGLNSLKNVKTLMLSHNNMTSVDDIKDLDQITNLDLSYNDIKDLTELKSNKNLMALSLSNNHNIDLSTLKNDVEVLNLEECSLNNDVSFSKYEHLGYVNVSHNPDLTDLDKFNQENLYEVDMEGMNYSIDNMNDSSLLNKIYGLTIVLPYNEVIDGEFHTEYGSWLNKKLMKDMVYGLKTSNVRINVNAKDMKITGDTPNINLSRYTFSFK